MLGKCPEKQITTMLKSCIVFSTGHNFACEETGVDIGEGQAAHCGAEDGCEGLLCKIKFEKNKSGKSCGT